jgi:hypothetical protein
VGLHILCIEALGCGTARLRSPSKAKSPDPAWWAGECRPAALSGLAPHHGVFLLQKDSVRWSQPIQQKKRIHLEAVTTPTYLTEMVKQRIKWSESSKEAVESDRIL